MGKGTKMNRWLLTIALVVTCLSVTVNKASACNVSPWASICPDYDYYENIPAGEPARFSLAAGDPDGEIAEWRVDFDDGSTPVSGSGCPPSQLTHEYSNAGIYNPTLWVLDDGSSPCSASDSCEVYVVEVYEVYEGVWNQGFNHGPVYLSLCQMAHLWALPYPGDWTNWPDGEPAWYVSNQPSGADADITVDPTYDDEVDITNLALPGNYVIEADCGDSTDDIIITASLPSGCGNAGPHDSSIHWNDSQNYNWGGPPFGLFLEKEATCDVDFKYSSGKWVCQISNVEAKTACYVISPDTPGLVCIDKASDVPCEPPTEPNQAKFDLTDTDLDDDEGPPNEKYWVHRAIVAHEEYHRWDWKRFYGPELDAAIHWCEQLCRNIDCSNPLTHTCEGAKSFWIAEIDKTLNDAYDIAEEDMDPKGTTLKEDEQRAYYITSFINHEIADALPEGCGS